jgi:MFS family permease
MAVQDGIAGLMPVMSLVYNGEDPKMLNGHHETIPAPKPGPYGQISANIDDMPSKPGNPSAQAISMLGTLPAVFIGLSSFVSIPLSEALGRRPVMLGLSVMAFFPLLWAASSQSLPSHLAARCIQAFGAGAIESLVPLVMQDISFIHERNRFMSTVWAIVVR